MAQISKAYTYKLPDTYYGNTSTEGKTATALYEGWDKLFVFVDTDGLLHVEEGAHPWNGREDERQGFVMRAGLGRRAVLLDIARSEDDTLIAAICMGQDLTKFETVDYAFPDGHANAGEVYHTDPNPLPVNDVVNTTKIFYDLENESWKIDEIEFSTQPSMEDHIAMRDKLIENAREYIEDPANEVTAEQIELINAYIADLENLYVKYAGIHQNMIGYTDWPIEAVEAEPPAEEAAEE